MRIDDENKVIWCNKEEMEWYKTYDSWENDKIKIIVHHLARIGFGYALTDKNGNETGKFWYDLPETQMELIKAVIDNYTFKLERTKKYYWRKKKEYLAWFEEENIYLNFATDTNSMFLSNENSDWSCKTKFVETEAHDILKDDFNKFEKVEIDE